MKYLSIILAALLIFSLSGCLKEGSSTIDLTEIASVSEATLESHLIGTTRDTIRKAWGAPDEVLTEAFADVYKIPDSTQQIILYYDQDGMLQDIKILENVSNK